MVLLTRSRNGKVPRLYTHDRPVGLGWIAPSQPSERIPYGNVEDQVLFSPGTAPEVYFVNDPLAAIGLVGFTEWGGQVEAEQEIR